MNKLFLLAAIVIIGCTNAKEEASKTLQKDSIENFTGFYDAFYKDTNFQNSRIIYPLKGEIKSWDENDKPNTETWPLGEKIIVVSKEALLNEYKNLKTTLEKMNSSVIEKLWIEQSGFYIEREFILKSGKWYLNRYDFSNV